MATDALALYNNLSQLILTTTTQEMVATVTSLFILMYGMYAIQRGLLLRLQRKAINYSIVTIHRQVYDQVI